MLSGVPRRVTFRSHPRPGDRSVLLQDIPKLRESGERRVSATAHSPISSYPVFADSLFLLPLSRAIKHPPRDGVTATATVHTYTVRVRVRKLHGGVLQTVAHERCRWQVITL